MKRKLVSLVLTLVLAGSLAAPVCQIPAQAAADEDFYQKLGQLLKSQEEDSYFNSMELSIGSKTLTVDGEQQQMDVSPALKNNRTMLPIRAVAEAAGAEVDFEDSTRTVVIVGASGDTIRCKTGSSTMTVNGTAHSLDTPSYIQGGRTYLPVRAVSEALELDVQWDAASRGVTITAPYQTARVLVWTEKLDTSALHPDTALYDGNGLWVLQFGKPSEAKNAAEALQAKGIDAQADTYLPPVSDKVSSGSSQSWGVSACGFDAFLKNNAAVLQGKSSVVAVVDTGVDASHPLLKNKVLQGRDFVDGDSDPMDEHSHGTHVAGTVADCTGSAAVKILPVRVLNGEGFGYDVTIVSGIRYAADQGADVINLSFRRDRTSTGTDNIDRAVQYAVGKGSLVVAAAGNDNQDTANYCPAHLTQAGVVVVSAGDSKQNKAEISNYGTSVDLMAPGVGIRSSVPGGGYRVMDGTSMAAPHVSAAAVLLDMASGNTLSPAQLESKVRAASTNGGTWKDKYMGCGFLTLAQEVQEPAPVLPEEPSPEAKVTSYRYSVSSLNLTAGESGSVKVTAVYSDGTTKDVTQDCGLRAANSSVVSVDKNGTVKALKKGSTTLSMSTTPAAGVSIPRPVSVTVTEAAPTVPVVTGYRYSNPSITLTEGTSTTVTVTAVYSDGSTRDVTREAALYSSNTGVAAVDTFGKITAVKSGTAVISMGMAPAAGVSLPAPITVKVTSPDLPPVTPVPEPVLPEDPDELVVSKIVLTATFVQLTPGQTSKLTAVVYSNSSSTVPVKWSTSDPSIAAVASDGTISAVRPGDCVVTATAQGKSASCRVRVNDYNRNDFGVTVLSGPKELIQGETGNFTLEIKTPIPYEAGSHPLVLYCALYARGAEGALNGWLEYQSKYYDGGTQTVIYQLDTSMHQLPSGTYRMALSLFYADRFYTGASICDTFTTLTLK